MNPDILTEHEKRLLQPAAPGILTNLIHGLLIFSAPAYAFSVWTNHGIKTLIRPTAFLPLAAIVGGDFVFQRVSSSARELLWGQSRADLVNSYKARWGEDYLLDSLNPVFRLPDRHEWSSKITIKSYETSKWHAIRLKILAFYRLVVYFFKWKVLLLFKINLLISMFLSYIWWMTHSWRKTI